MNLKKRMESEQEYYEHGENKTSSIALTKEQVDFVLQGLELLQLIPMSKGLKERVKGTSNWIYKTSRLS